MTDKDRIATYYFNARELVKQNNPKAARAYVLAILNYALESYQNAKSILVRVKTQLFLDKWIQVSRELYDKGVSDYVLKCFGLPTKQEQELPKIKTKSGKETQMPPEKECPQDKDKPVSKGNALPVGEIDISGLIDDSAKEQGWCAALFEKYKRAVVEINAFAGENHSNGTGFIISDKGYFLTNDHVVFDDETDTYCSKIKISFAGEKKSYKANVLFSDKKSDVALCSFNPDEVGDFSVIQRVKDYSKVAQGADCLIIGNAFGMGLSPFTGVVRFTKNDKGNLVYTAPSNPGDSGGPVLNRKGECIGINKSKTVAVKNVTADAYANATPMDKVNELLKIWCNNNENIL